MTGRKDADDWRAKNKTTSRDTNTKNKKNDTKLTYLPENLIQCGLSACYRKAWLKTTAFSVSYLRHLKLMSFSFLL